MHFDQQQFWIIEVVFVFQNIYHATLSDDYRINCSTKQSCEKPKKKERNKQSSELLFYSLFRYDP